MAIRFLFCLVLILVAQVAVADNLQFEHLLSDESAELQDNISTVNSIEQDTRGFIWIGGENGLARFDGHQMVFYHAGPAGSGQLSGNYIRGLVVDKTGVLWVATLTGLNRYDAARDRFEAYRHDPQDPASLPSDNLSSLAVDQANNLWFGTGQGVGVFDAQRQVFRFFRHDPQDPLSLSDNRIRPIMVDSRNRLWIGTTEGGLNRVDFLPRPGEPLRVTRYLPDSHTSHALSLKMVTALAEDNRGRIWIGTHGGGISRLEPDLVSFRQYQPNTHNSNALGSNTIWAIKQDGRGQIWIACDKGGLIRYHEQTDSFEADIHSDTNSRSISTNTTRALAEDRDGDMWIGNFPNGVNYFNRATAVFANFSHQQNNPTSLSNKAVISFLEDSTGEIWVGTEDGLNRFNPATGQFKQYLKDLKNPKALQASAILSLVEGPGGDLWVGTWSGGVFRFNRKTEEFRQYKTTGEPGALNSNYVWHMVYDRQQRLWLGTQTGGLNLYQPESDSFVSFTADPRNPHALSADFIWNLLEDKQGRLWVATEVGLDLFDPQSQKFRHFSLAATTKGQNNSLILEIMQHSNGDIWLGTQDKGIAILNRVSETFSFISTAEGLSSPWVTSLVEDNDHNVWAATFNGLSRLDGRTGAIKTFGKSHGLVGNNFNRDASFKDRHGTLYIGGTEGFSRFDPRAMVDNPLRHEPVFTGLWVHDNPTSLPANQAPLILDYHQNSVAVKFSAMNFRAAHKNLYQFKMEGFDKSWSTPKTVNQATYTNLNPGRYVFRVRAANSDGVWSDKTIALPLTILPPPWRTWWAYSIYILLGLCFIFACGLAVYLQLRARRVELANEKALTVKLRKLDKMKDAFLANTSHELRTPLNGIIGLAESMLDDDHGDPLARQSLQMIIASGQRLAHLVNDILDCAKLAERQLSLQQRPVDLKQSVDTILALLKPLAEQKKLQLDNRVPPIEVLADDNRLQQILFNLIGNAVKYTFSGSVSVAATRLGEQVRIEVSDTGIGIAPEDLDGIFALFSQISDSDTRNTSGTGLGLAITKQLVELHGSRLLVSSQPGVGTVFSFALPAASEGTSASTLKQNSL